MYYIKSIPENNNHGNPMCQSFPNCVELPDNLLKSYLDAKGFVNLVVTDNLVFSLSINQEALDAYNKDHPEVEPTKLPTNEERISALEDVMLEMLGVTTNE